MSVWHVDEGDYYLFEANDFVRAIFHYHSAIEANPDSVEAYKHLGAAYYIQHDYENTRKALKAALSLKPDEPEVLANIANTYYAEANHDEAVDYYRRSLDIRNSDGIALRLALIVPPMMRSAQEIAEVRSALKFSVEALLEAPPKLTDPLKEHGQTNFYLSYHGVSNRALVSDIADLYLKACPALAFESPHCRLASKPNTSSLRIVTVCAYLYHHTIGKLMQGLIRELSAHGLEICVAIFDPQKRTLAQELLGNSVDIIVLSNQLTEAQRQVASCKADLVLYPEIGMDTLTYFLAFARLAPVQCVMWGHPDTTGIPAIDYYLSSNLIEPFDAQQHYRETLIQLNELPMYYTRPEPESTGSRSQFGLSEQDHIYLCPQTLFKFHPDFDVIIAQILHKDPLGKLVLINSLYPHWKDMLIARWKVSMPDALKQVVFLPSLPQQQFYQLLQCADVMLDPFYFGGGNTTFEALALGVPIVTLPGEFMRGRVTHGCYRRMEYDELIARNEEEYVSLCNRLAMDSNFRLECRKEILKRSDVLFENKAAVEEIAATLKKCILEKRV